MNKDRIFCLLFSVLALGCGQQQSNQTTTSPSVQNEVVVASTPITAPATPAEPISQPKELVLEKQTSPSLYTITRNKAIQLALRNSNFYSGEIDGKIGPKTKEAIKQFQLSKNLTVDGIVGHRTWEELKAYLPEE